MTLSVEQIAEILAAHRDFALHEKVYCLCGESIELQSDRRPWQTWTAHVAAQIKLALDKEAQGGTVKKQGKVEIAYGRTPISQALYDMIPALEKLEQEQVSAAVAATYEDAADVELDITDGSGRTLPRGLDEPFRRAITDLATEKERGALARVVASRTKELREAARPLRGALQLFISHCAWIRPKGTGSETPRECPCCEKVEDAHGKISHYLSCHFDHARRVVKAYDRSIKNDRYTRSIS